MKAFKFMFVLAVALFSSVPVFAGDLSAGDMKIFRNSFMASCTQTIKSSKNGGRFSDEKITNYCSCSATSAGNALTNEEIKYRQRTGKNSPAYISQVKASAKKCLKELLN